MRLFALLSVFIVACIGTCMCAPGNPQVLGLMNTDTKGLSVAVVDPLKNSVLHNYPFTSGDVAVYSGFAVSPKTKTALFAFARIVLSDDSFDSYVAQLQVPSLKDVNNSDHKLSAQYGALNNPFSNFIAAGDRKSWAIFKNNKKRQVTLARVDWNTGNVAQPITLPNTSAYLGWAGDNNGAAYLVAQPRNSGRNIQGQILPVNLGTQKVGKGVPYNCPFNAGPSSRAPPFTSVHLIGNQLVSVAYPSLLFSININTGACKSYQNLTCGKNPHAPSDAVNDIGFDSARGAIYASISQDDPKKGAKYGCISAVKWGQNPLKPTYSPKTARFSLGGLLVVA